ncbi:MAG: membrane protein insertase YidC [Phenylobacterium sp.]|uniref:membrane protein insertase YidC n=1 Tax=Phenylobacterium sp. TaxID=1871053 RepID=UPI00273684AB|nr:membrane protein insertase YidC [Phenylobacterium sp.]MDP3172918.1 membrane protein insertase YidC [Phenylobacterium sp.]
MRDDSTRNTIIFVVCSLALLLLYQVFILEPAAHRRQAEAARKPAAAIGATAGPAAGTLPGVAAPAQVHVVTRQEAAATSPRVTIDTPALQGSISLKGARFDDLFLKQYRETVDPNSPPVELLRPEGALHAWFAEFGWTGANVPGLPNANTVWTVTQGSTLTPTSPLTLQYVSPAGLTFTRQIAIDARFMFTVTDTVANTGAAPVSLAPYGSVQRQGAPAHVGHSQIVHEGAIGWLGDELRLIKYSKWAKDGGMELPSRGGWTGITDMYWLAALIPSQSENVRGAFRVTKAGDTNIFEANYVGALRQIPVGKQVTETTRFFAGAKTVPVLKGYEKQFDIPNLNWAVDWGRLRLLTQPIFSFLEFIYRHVGNFGLAILGLTVVVRLLFFPLANKQYESMTKMKKLQPQMEELRARFKEDPAKQQQEIMALYQREKVNPIAGCLPLLLQIPVFFALYKVLSVTIEMRHAPFMGWIKDLSARDPTTIWNLFGLIPWNPASTPLIGQILDSTLHLGVLPLAYGFTMWLTTSMSPPVGDPMQQRIFKLMPLLFMFIMAPFAVGLLIYWTWSNVLTILQQYVIMRRLKVDNPVDQLIARFTGKSRAA